jgi:UDP-GlcNAc:undecaprenyl-phosphate GlcNAc-1-phosphate transferase
VALALITDVFLVVGVVAVGLLVAVLASAIPRLRTR